MVHGDTKRIPLLKGQEQSDPREFLFVVVDDFSRELYAAIFPDKTSHLARRFLDQVIGEVPYTIEVWYSDNGKEYKCDPENRVLMVGCSEAKIEQGFTLPKTPRTNGKAKRVIRMITQRLYEETEFQSNP